MRLNVKVMASNSNASSLALRKRPTKLRRMWQHIKSQTWVLKTQLMFSAVAMLLCLYAMSVVHQHEQGYHSAQSDCISCDIESLLGHGLMSSVVVSFDIPFAQIPYDAVTSVCQPRAVLAAFQARAPPFS